MTATITNYDSDGILIPIASGQDDGQHVLCGQIKT